MNNFSKKSSILFRNPSFLKGMSRVMDLGGKLDEYRYQTDPDTKAIAKDWKMIGLDIYESIKQYVKK